MAMLILQVANTVAYQDYNRHRRKTHYPLDTCKLGTTVTDDVPTSTDAGNTRWRSPNRKWLYFTFYNRWTSNYNDTLVFGEAELNERMSTSNDTGNIGWYTLASDLLTALWYFRCRKKSASVRIPSVEFATQNFSEIRFAAQILLFQRLFCNRKHLMFTAWWILFP